MSQAFDRLSPALQHQIVHTLGFRGLRPVQAQATDAILDGDNCVVLAPTAGGKTEASFFPLLSLMDTEEWSPVSVIYLSPIRALLNNQEDRVERLADLVGRRAFKWHGDVNQSARKRFFRAPTDVLLTTPESLEAMLMSAKFPARQLFAGLQAVIIDEVHAFADDDRGAHLSAVLERLVRFCRRDLQRIGLSATVGNPDEILGWLQGSSKRPSRVVDPGGEKKAAQLALDFVGGLENAALVIRSLHPGKKRLVFVDSRRKAETLGKLLSDGGVRAYVMHGSLSVAERQDAERAFQDGKDCVIVATSAMELGIDIGDLDHVLQIDSPPTVASFLQRMGRTGRREGAFPNCTFLATTAAGLQQAAAVLALHSEGYVEPVRPSYEAFHLYAHQAMALSVQTAGLVRSELWTWLEGASAFRATTEADRTAIVDHMLSEEILAEDEGRLWLGPHGERKYGRANFRELYAVFSSPRLITVRVDNKDIGQVEAQFLAALEGPEGYSGTCFTLAARAWLVEHIDWERGVCIVRPAPVGNAPRWNGGARWLSYDMMQAMRRVLVDDNTPESWSQRAREAMATERANYAFLRDSDSPLIEGKDEATWWNFAGGAANLLLAQLLESELGSKLVARNSSLTFKEGAAKSTAAIRQTLTSLQQDSRPTEADVLRFAEGAKRGRLSKFEPCLPDGLLQRYFGATVVDADGARRALSLLGKQRDEPS
ncbi:MAG: DEAD/DEAH box helicase [Myxococcales bacterium]|nr:DEAD/DEAH box helicase [Myxococcales bacterium]